MRIATSHVDLPHESKGGVAHQVHYLANTLANRGHDVTMFTFSPADDGCCYHVRQYQTTARRRRARSLHLAYHLARTDFSSFDVLHTHGDNFLLWSCHPQVRTFYGSARDEAAAAVTLQARGHYRLFAWLEQLGARAADVCVGISEATRARLPAISTVVPCGVDVNRFRPGPKAEKPVVLFVGTAGGRKRGAFLAEIFRREVRQRFPDAELWAVADQPLEGPGVVNFGKVPLETLTELFQRAWVFCLPSTYEGFGVPYIEAMAAGTPVVATPNPGAWEVLSAGEYGLLAEDDQLGSSLNLLLNNPRMRRRYAEKGLIRAQEFSWDRVAARYERIYGELIASRSQVAARATRRRMPG